MDEEVLYASDPTFLTDILEVQKLVQSQNRQNQEFELELRKRRDQKRALMILKTLRLVKTLETYQENVNESTERWNSEVEALAVSVQVRDRQELERRLTESQKRRSQTVRQVMSLLPIEPIIFQNLRSDSQLRSRVARYVAEEEETSEYPLDLSVNRDSGFIPERTIEDRLLEGVLTGDLHRMLQIGNECRYLAHQELSLGGKNRGVTLPDNHHSQVALTRSIHNKTRSCQPVTLPEKSPEEALSRSLSFTEFQLSADSSIARREEVLDSSAEEEMNRLAILNSSLLRSNSNKKSQRENKSVEVQDEDLLFISSPTSARQTITEDANKRTWKRCLCPCIWREV